MLIFSPKTYSEHNKTGVGAAFSSFHAYTPAHFQILFLTLVKFRDAAHSQPLPVPPHKRKNAFFKIKSAILAYSPYFSTWFQPQNNMTQNKPL